MPLLFLEKLRQLKKLKLITLKVFGAGIQQ